MPFFGPFGAPLLSAPPCIRHLRRPVTTGGPEALDRFVTCYARSMRGGISMNNASRRIGRNESFVHRRRGHLIELSERDREKLAQVLGIPPDDLRGLATFLPSSMNGGSRSAETPTSKNCVNHAAPANLPCARSAPRSPTVASPRLPQRPCGTYSKKRIRALRRPAR